MPFIKVENSVDNENEAFINVLKTFSKSKKFRSEEWFFPCLFCESDTAYICKVKDDGLYYVCPQCQKMY